MTIGYNCRTQLAKRAFNGLVDVSSVSPDAVGLWIGASFNGGNISERTLLIKRTFEMLREFVVELFDSEIGLPGPSGNVTIKINQTKKDIVLNAAVASIAADDCAIIVGDEFPKSSGLFMEVCERGYQRIVEQGHANAWTPTVP